MIHTYDLIYYKSKILILAPHIAFTAVGVVDLSPSNGQTIIFSSTRLNEGNAYNTSTGVFTSPVNGTFSFSTQFCVPPNKVLFIAIVVDGINYATSLIYDSDAHACDTGTAVAMLHVNSKVWVMCTSANSRDIIYPADAKNMNSFSGYLINVR